MLWPLLVAAAVAGILLWNLLPRVIEETAVSDLTDMLPILTPLVGAELDRDPQELQAWLAELTRETELRVTVIRDDGLVLADNARTWEQVEQMDNHRLRPEIDQAFVRQRGNSVRRSDTTGLSYVYVAVRATDAEGRLFVLRVAEPLRELQALRSNLLKILMLTAAVSGLAVLLVWAGLNARLFRPLRELVEGADRLARGDFSGHLESPEVPELAALAAALNRMSDRVAEQIEHVRAERNHLQDILSSMEDGLLVVDDQGAVRFLNDAFRSIFEIEAETEYPDLLELTARSEIVDLVRSALQDGEASSELQLSVNGGRLVSATAAPVGDGGAVLVVRDVTERLRLDETRRDFVANVSHEIKTPLTAIRGYAETMKEGALEEPAVAAKFTDRILAQCKRLEALLSDLLPLARMEAAEERPLEFAPIDLQEMIEHSTEIIRPKAEKRRIELRIEMPDEVPRFVGDAESLEQLTLNLLDNAVKYNRLGGRVRLTVRDIGEEVVLAVEDTGIGIPPESLPRVFERFYRVDKGRARDEGGTGLGLALVKHAAKLHGGRVELDSKLGIGSTFRVHLPASPPMSQAS